MLKTPTQRILISTLLLLLIGLADRVTSFEITTAPFYLFPIIVFSYQNRIRFIYSLLFSVVAFLIWLYVDYCTHPYSSQQYAFINRTTRLAIFLIASYVLNLFYKEKTQREIIATQKAELEKTNAELNKFIGVAAHDIRNPVGSIAMMAELLLEDEEIPAEKKEYITLISNTAQTALQILNNTLNVSKIQSGVVELNLVRQDYIGFVKECVLLNQHLAQKKQQTMVISTEIEKQEMLFDKTRLSQVLNNLLTNAVKYSEPGTDIELRILYDENKTHIITHVTDQGLGIDEKDRDGVFTAFVTTSNKPTHNESKTGLGLAIAKRIVEAHKGTIDFTSEKGKGSDFFFSLPLN